MNVYGNVDTNGDGLNEHRKIEIKILLPDKKLIEICGFKGSLQKSMTFKCNDWAIDIKTKKKII
jgi:hypothetical protein